MHYHESNATLCFKNLAEKDNGRYSLTYEQNFTEISKKHNLIAKDAVPTPSLSVTVKLINATAGFCVFSVNCSVQRRLLTTECDGDGCRPPRASFPELNITVSPGNGTLTCTGNNLVPRVIPSQPQEQHSEQRVSTSSTQAEATYENVESENTEQSPDPEEQEVDTHTVYCVLEPLPPSGREEATPDEPGDLEQSGVHTVYKPPNPRVYFCRGQDDHVITRQSNDVTVDTALTVSPSQLEVFVGESLTLRCEVEGGADTEWTYHWSRNRLNPPPTTREYTVSRVTESDTGAYSCRAQRGPHHTTVWSTGASVTVKNKPQARVSGPSELQTGGSVELFCSVSPSSSGWKYEWSRNEQFFKESSSEAQVTVSEGGEYQCRAHRGDPPYFTEDSHKFRLRNTDAEGPESLWVSPDRAQHFTDDVITLSCGFNSTGADRTLYRSFYNNTITTQQRYYYKSKDKSKCEFRLRDKTRAVFWCESGSGEMSNAVNISVHSDIILLSPVRAVMEGQSVSLSCKLRTGTFTSVQFYKNGNIIQNGTNPEFNISAVSRSDQGFYKCEGQRKLWTKTVTSAESWMSIKSAAKADLSPLPVMWVVGPVCAGLFLFILLLLLWRCSQTKGKSSSSENDEGNEGQDNQQQLYSSLLHGDNCVYETIQNPRNRNDEELGDYSNLPLRCITVRMEVSLLWTLRFICESTFVHNEEFRPGSQLSTSISVFCIVICKRTTGDRATLDVPPHTVYLEDTVRLTCSGHDVNKLHFYKDGSLVQEDEYYFFQQVQNNRYLRVNSVSKSSEGLYSCGTKEEIQSPEKELKVTEHPRRVELTVSNTDRPVEGSVTLSCDVEDFNEELQWFSAHWKYIYYFEQTLNVSLGGVYSCCGWDDHVVTRKSNDVTVEDTALTVSPSQLEVFVGESLTLRCEVEGGADTEWTYHWSRNRLNPPPTTREYTVSRVTESDTGAYSCRAQRGPHHTTVWSTGASVTVKKKTLSFESNSALTSSSAQLSAFYNVVMSREPMMHSTDKPQARVSGPSELQTGGSVKLFCSVSPSSSGWKYEWSRNEQFFKESSSEAQVTVSEGGEYQCRAHRGDPPYFTEDSHKFRLRNTGAAKADLSPLPVMWVVGPVCAGLFLFILLLLLWRCSKTKGQSSSSILPFAVPSHRDDLGLGSATLSLSRNVTVRMEVSLLWTLRFICESTFVHNEEFRPGSQLSTSISVFCIVICKRTTGDRATLDVPPHTVYLEDTVRLTCSGHDVNKLHFYKDGSLVQEDEYYFFQQVQNNRYLRVNSVSKSSEGLYSCGTKEEIQSPEKELKVTEHPRRVELTVSNTDRPVEGSVTLSCDVEDFNEELQWFSAHWKYIYYFEQTLNVSLGGVYSCCGWDDHVVTRKSNDVTVEDTALTVSPSQLEVFVGESLTLRCEVEGGADTEWTYHWSRNRLNPPPTTREYTVSRVTESDTGAYSCRAQRGPHHTTVWSTGASVTVKNKPQARVSGPSELQTGGSVKLFCSVSPSSSGWKYEWSRNEQFFKESSSEAQVTVSEGGEYQCRAHRGDPPYFTEDSHKFRLRNTDAEGPESLWVSPDRAQHFTDDVITLSCGFNSTGADRTLYRSFYNNTITTQQCDNYKSKDKSKCEFRLRDKTRAVFWCESGSGEMSNAVNISVHSDIILLSPVRAVMEGQSVSLSCKLRTGTFTSVQFYKNGSIIQNGTNPEFNISAVSRSDQGFYKCEGQRKLWTKTVTSPESWMSIKSAAKADLSPLPVMWVVGPVCAGLFLFILLLLLWRCSKTKGQSSSRSVLSF
ncbi:uncharacterized protein [Eucyclogobius newberryi]|uniref:uncharacterized protein n=1 Tax=Eucyclogobius newberryi TaxID=166745 RepID=UPI003B5C97BF